MWYCNCALVQNECTKFRNLSKITGKSDSARPITDAQEPMETLATKTSVKVVGSNGQISIGKEFAGRQVLVEQQAPGVWLVRTALVVPENELWLHQPQARDDLRRALRGS